MKKVILIQILFLFSHLIFANPYKIQTPHRASLEIIFNEASTLMPKMIFEQIGKKIYIEAYRFQERSDFENICQWSGNINLAAVSPWRFGKKFIRIDYELLKYVNHPKFEEKLPCFKFHGSIRNLLLSLIIHETAHLFDLSFITKNDDRYTKNIKRNRAKDEFRNHKEFSSISKSSYYTTKFGWGERGNSHKNDNPTRSVDLYEFENSSEHFAVNSEFYFLDPNFACKRPFTAMVFDKIYALSKSKNNECLKNIPIDMGVYGTASIEVEKIFAIDYISVDDGDDMASSFGHSMIRLVICSNKRDAISIECYKDISQHYALSFAANVTTKNIETLKGIFGGYHSQLSITPFINKKTQYNISEGRNISAYPLHFSREQMLNYFYNLMEIHWGHRSNYYFFTTNCATETQDSLRQTLSENHPFQKLNSITPNGVKEDIVFSKLSIDRDLFPYQNSLFYEGQNDRIAMMFKLILPFTENRYENLKAYQNDFDNTFKFSLFKKLESKEDKKIWMAMAYLENSKKSSLQEDIYALVNENIQTKNMNEEFTAQFLYDYGIPSHDTSLNKNENGSEMVNNELIELPYDIHEVDNLITRVNSNKYCEKERLYLGHIKSFKIKNMNRQKLTATLETGVAKLEILFEHLRKSEQLYAHILVSYVLDLQNKKQDGPCEMSQHDMDSYRRLYQDYFL